MEWTPCVVYWRSAFSSSFVSEIMEVEAVLFLVLPAVALVLIVVLLVLPVVLLVQRG